MNKEIERILLNGFSSVYKNFPNGTVEDSESPDFLIETDAETLGIEVKQIFKHPVSHGSSLQAQEKFRQIILNRSASIYLEQGGVPISAYFVFKIDKTIDRKEVMDISEEVSALLLSKDLQSNEIYLLDYKDLPASLLKILDSIVLHKRPGLDHPNFSLLSSGWESELEPSRVFLEVMDKESKISNYKMKCQKIWLLLVACDFTNATSVSLSTEAVNYLYPTSFDKVFFYWHFQPHYIEFKIYQPID